MENKYVVGQQYIFQEGSSYHPAVLEVTDVSYDTGYASKQVYYKIVSGHYLFPDADGHFSIGSPFDAWLIPYQKMTEEQMAKLIDSSELWIDILSEVSEA